jgi:hypothetical protein
MPQCGIFFFLFFSLPANLFCEHQEIGYRNRNRHWEKVIVFQTAGFPPPLILKAQASFKSLMAKAHLKGKQ